MKMLIKSTKESKGLRYQTLIHNKYIYIFRQEQSLKMLNENPEYGHQYAQQQQSIIISFRAKNCYYNI